MYLLYWKLWCGCTCSQKRRRGKQGRRVPTVVCDSHLQCLCSEPSISCQCTWMAYPKKSTTCKCAHNKERGTQTFIHLNYISSLNKVIDLHVHFARLSSQHSSYYGWFLKHQNDHLNLLLTFSIIHVFVCLFCSVLFCSVLFCMSVSADGGYTCQSKDPKLHDERLRTACSTCHCGLTRRNTLTKIDCTIMADQFGVLKAGENLFNTCTHEDTHQIVIS